MTTVHQPAHPPANIQLFYNQPYPRGTILNYRQLQSQETELENLQHQVNKLELIVGEQASKDRNRFVVAARERAGLKGVVKDNDERHQPEQRRSDHQQVRRTCVHAKHPLIFLFSLSLKMLMPPICLKWVANQPVQQGVRNAGTYRKAAFAALPASLCGCNGFDPDFKRQAE